MDKRNKKRVAILGGTLVAFAGVGIALAAYLSSGTGTGQAVGSTAVNSTISSASQGTALYPGSTSAFTISVNNPNPYPVTVTSISAGSSNATGTSNACVAGTVTSTAVASPPTTVIAPNGSGTYTLSAKMAPNADNTCQGQTFTLPLTAQLASAAT